MPRELVLATLPANLSTVSTRVVCVSDGSTLVLDVSSALSVVPVERAAPVRRFYAWPGKRNYDGSWWSSTTGSHLVFESLLERQALMRFDADPEVTGLAVQPMALLWPRGWPRPRFHVPDLFVRRADGSGHLVDVRPLSRIDADAKMQFDRTRQMAAAVEWTYEVFTGLAQPRLSNLEFVAGYRSDRCRPASPLERLISSTFAGGARLGVGIDRVCEAGLAGRDLGLAGVYWLMWQGQLSVDWDAPLAMSSRVWS